MTAHPSCLPPRGHPARCYAIAFLAIAPFLVGLLALYLGQDANWDLRNYHWYNAYALLHGRLLFDLLPSQTPFFYNPALDVPFYLLATHSPARATAFALGVVQGLNVPLMFMLAYALRPVATPPGRAVWVAMALAMLGLLGGGGIAQIGTVFYDNVTSLGYLGSALLVARFYDRLLRDTPMRAAGLAFLFALPSGLMTGCKLPGIVFAAALCLALPLAAGTLRRRALLAIAFGLGTVAGIALSFGPWGLFLNARYDSPMFPYFNGLFHSPLAPLTSARDTQFLPSTWQDKLFFPFIFADNPLKVGEIVWRDWRVPMLYALYALLPIMLAVRWFLRRRNATALIPEASPATRYLLWIGAFAYIVWLFLFAIYRYLVPLEMLAPLLIALLIGLMPAPSRLRMALTALALIVVACSVHAGTWGRAPRWLDRAVEFAYPEDMPIATDTMMLMAGYEPYAHAVTVLPPSVPVVRVQSNFAEPGDGKGINRIIRARIDAHRGPFMLLIPDWQHALAQDMIRGYGLALREKTCRPVADRLYDSRLTLCSVARVATSKEK